MKMVMTMMMKMAKLMVTQMMPRVGDGEVMSQRRVNPRKLEGRAITTIDASSTKPSTVIMVMRRMWMMITMMRTRKMITRMMEAITRNPYQVQRHFFNQTINDADEDNVLKPFASLELSFLTLHFLFELVLHQYYNRGKSNILNNFSDCPECRPCLR